MHEFGSDTCVRISEPRTFFLMMTLELLRIGKIIPLFNNAGPAPCIYKSRHIEVNGKIASDYDAPDINQSPVWLQKDPSYSYQKEVRMTWVPKEKNPDQFIYLKCEAFRNNCEIIKL